MLNIAYWVLGQGLGGIFQGGATDPNAGPLFILFSYVMYALLPYEQPATEAARERRAAPEIAVAGRP